MGVYLLVSRSGPRATSTMTSLWSVLAGSSWTLREYAIYPYPSSQWWVLMVWGDCSVRRCQRQYPEIPDNMLIENCKIDSKNEPTANALRRYGGCIQSAAAMRDSDNLGNALSLEEPRTGSGSQWYLTRAAKVFELDSASALHTVFVLDLKVGRTLNVLSPFVPVLCHSDWFFHGESCPRHDVVYPGRAWPWCQSLGFTAETFFSKVFVVLLKCSTIPFPIAWYGVVVHCLMFNNRDVYRADNSFYRLFAIEHRRVTVKSLLSSILDQLVQLNRNIGNNNNIINVSQMAQLADRRREALNSYSLQCGCLQLA